MQAVGIKPLVDRNYRASHTFQWVRELVVNSLQAGATDVRFTTEWQAAQSLGVHRRMVVDNGSGIPASLMLAYLAKYGGSGKSIGDIVENFGIGFKSSALPWNKYGLVVISRHNGEASMIWLQCDPDADGGMGTYGARMFDVGNDSGVMDAVVPLDAMVDIDEDGNEVNRFIEDGVDWTKVFTGTHDGVCVVFLGDHPEQHTVMGDPGRAEDAKYGIVQYINSRFWTLPEGVRISVDQYEDWTQAQNTNFQKVKPHKQARRPDGLLRNIEARMGRVSAEGKKRSGSGTIEVEGTKGRPGATIHWWLADPAPKAQNDSDQTSAQGHIVNFPMAGLVFSSHDGVEEVFDLRATGAGKPTMRMNQFVKVSDVRDRLAVLVVPHSDHDGVHIFPEQSRTSLKYESPSHGGQDLDWDWWASAWHTRMPAVVRSEIDAYYRDRAVNAESGLRDEDYQRLSQRYLGSLRRKVEKFFPRQGGDETGRGGNVDPVKRTGRRRVRKADPDAPSKKGKTPDERAGDDSIRGTRRKGDSGMVKVVMDSRPEDPSAVIFDPNENSAVINRDSSSYRRAMEAIVDSTVARRGSLNDHQVKLVEGAIETAMQAVVSTCLTEVTAEVVARPDEKDSLISDAAVSTVMMGIMHIESVASGYIGAALSAKKRSAA